MEYFVSPGPIPVLGRCLNFCWVDESESLKMLPHTWVTWLGVWVPAAFNTLPLSPQLSYTCIGLLPALASFFPLGTLISSWNPSLLPRFYMCYSDKFSLCGQCHQRALHVGTVGRLLSGALINENKCVGWGQNIGGDVSCTEKKNTATYCDYLEMSSWDCTLRFYKYFNI